MMKRMISIILVMVMCLLLPACADKTNNVNSGANNSDVDLKGIVKATIVTNSGETVELTANELFAEYDADLAKFNKDFRGAKITFKGTVSYVAVGASVVVDSTSVKAGQNKIVFDEGWCLVTSTDNTSIDVEDYETGDVLEVTSSIAGAPYDTDFFAIICDDNRVVWLVGNDKFIGSKSFYSDIETVIKQID